MRNIDAETSSIIITEFRKSKNSIIFLDYDGTLVPFATYPELAIIDPGTLGIIRKLSDDLSNQIVIISGRNKNFLEKQFDNVNVTLVAEHGYYVRKPGGAWEITDNSGLQWKNKLLPVLSEYAERCKGAFVEEKSGCLAWHYRNADDELVLPVLNELRNALNMILQYLNDIEILEGNKVLEVKSKLYNKGIAAVNLMGNSCFDFIFAAGDEKTDELLFRNLPDSAWSISVGPVPSVSKYKVRDIQQLLELLRRMGQ